MALRNSPDRWGVMAQAIHWLVFILIVSAWFAVENAHELPKGDPGRDPWMALHKAFGASVFFLVWLRLGWRLFDPRPAEPASMSRWQVAGARVGHALLYALLFAVPLSGWLFDSATALRPLIWWGLVPMPSLTGGAAPGLKDIAKEAHEWLFWTLVLVAAGHAAAALVHHFVNRDEVLRRMLPQRRSRIG